MDGPSEYIRDKNHVRMNATKWVTLSGFCKYLGSSGQCKIDETEKGNSFISFTWIDRNPETLACQKDLEKKNDNKRRFCEKNVDLKTAISSSIFSIFLEQKQRRNLSEKLFLGVRLTQ